MAIELYNADCYEKIKDIPNNSVDLVIIDPPYLINGGKDGRLVSDAHIREQFDMLEQLRQRGYMAEFACGFDEAKKIIDEYLG